MLASQTMDGVLRVWSVSKPPTAEQPKTIRILKRSDNVEPCPGRLNDALNGQSGIQRDLRGGIMRVFYKITGPNRVKLYREGA